MSLVVPLGSLIWSIYYAGEYARASDSNIQIPEPCYGQFDMIYTFNSRSRATFESPVKVNLSHIRRPEAFLKYTCKHFLVIKHLGSIYHGSSSFSILKCPFKWNIYIPFHIVQTMEVWKEFVQWRWKKQISTIQDLLSWLHCLWYNLCINLKYIYTNNPVLIRKVEEMLGFSS